LPASSRDRYSVSGGVADARAAGTSRGWDPPSLVEHSAVFTSFAFGAA